MADAGKYRTATTAHYLWCDTLSPHASVTIRFTVHGVTVFMSRYKGNGER